MNNLHLLESLIIIKATSLLTNKKKFIDFMKGKLKIFLEHKNLNLKKVKILCGYLKLALKWKRNTMGQ